MFTVCIGLIGYGELTFKMDKKAFKDFENFFTLKKGECFVVQGFIEEKYFNVSKKGDKKIVLYASKIIYVSHDAL